MGIQTPTYEPNEDLTMAEGQLEAAEGQEDRHYNPRMSAELPIIRQREIINIAAETGLVAIVNLGAEGKDDDEAQDASLTGGETIAPLNSTETPMPIMPTTPLSLTDTPTTGDMPTADDMTPQTQLEDAQTVLSQKKVLIVEDNQELAEVIIATLERMKLKVVHETHGDKAVARFWEMNPDVMLLDLVLPDTKGWTIMDAIKERLDATQGEMPKVIVITAQDDPANRLIGKLQGVHSYLVKPFTTDEIETIVMQALDISPAS